MTNDKDGAASVEPVAWMYEKNGKRCFPPDRQPWNVERGWIESALYARPEADTIGSHFGNGGGLDPVRACGCPECEASPSFGGGDLREALDQCEQCNRIVCVPVDLYRKVIAALAALPPVKQSVGKFQRGDHVEKVSGSNWRGKVVGEYSTDLTPEGYAVESDTETGSVQIYPAKALRLSHDQRGGSGE